MSNDPALKRGQEALEFLERLAKAQPVSKFHGQSLINTYLRLPGSDKEWGFFELRLEAQLITGGLDAVIAHAKATATP